MLVINANGTPGNQYGKYHSQIYQPEHTQY
jgi:hypothetical protein